MSIQSVSQEERDLARIVFVVRQLCEGRSNAVGSFTLDASQTSTTITAPNCGSGSTVLYTPTTANASAEIGAGTIYVGTVSNGSFVVTHASNLQADRTFLYVVIG